MSKQVQQEIRTTEEEILHTQAFFFILGFCFGTSFGLIIAALWHLRR